MSDPRLVQDDEYPIVTKSGRKLYKEDIDALADEAERGYDISHLVKAQRALEQRVELLERSRPGRKAKPIVVSERGVCGVDPDRDSSDCPDASLYRRNKGCLGTSCQRISDAYYAARRQ